MVLDYDAVFFFLRYSFIIFLLSLWSEQSVGYCKDPIQIKVTIVTNDVLHDQLISQCF